MKKETGGPAFPRSGDFNPQTGMTLRDYFAAKATEEDIKAASKFVGYVEINGVTCDPPNKRQLARYIHADAMLKAREQ